MIMRRMTVVVVTLLLAAGAAAQPTTIGGFADAAWFYDAASRAGEFGVDQVEIDVEHRASAKSLIRADLEWLKDGEGYLAQVEQAYMTYNASRGWSLSFGKFNAPIGVELLDPTDMFQYSHSLLFTYAAPTNLTGLKVARDFGHGVDLVGHVSNGWDRATADKHVTWGGRLGLASGGFSGGLGAISGKEDTAGENPGDPSSPLTRTVFDADLTFVSGVWRFCGEVSLGDVTTTGDAQAQWLGLLCMTHVELSTWAGLTVRLDHLDDEDGYLFGAVDGQYQTRQSLTIAPTFALDEGLGALVELRVDRSDRDAFTDGDGAPAATATSVAVEMTYSW
jgi:hypothetical protein